MFSGKDLKVKLAYMGFGGIIAIIGMLFGIGMVSSSTAQKDKFGEIECSSLRVVDEDGITRVILSTDDRAGYDDENIRVSIDGDAYDGSVRVYGEAGSKFGSAKAVLGISRVGISEGNVITEKTRQAGYVGAYGDNRAGSAELSINKHGGMVDVRGKDPITTGAFIGINQNENGGVVEVYGMGDGKSEARLGISENGGGIDVFGKDGELRVGLSTDEHGGAVRAYGKDGKLAVLLGTDERGGNVLVNGKDAKSGMILHTGDYGGNILVSGKDGKSGVSLNTVEHGAKIVVVGKGEGMAVMGINEYGNGAVSTWDKNGYRQ